MITSNNPNNGQSYTPLTSTPPAISTPEPEILPGMTVHISIGFNIGGQPMSPAMRKAFADLVTDDVNDVLNINPFMSDASWSKHYGIGFWENEREDSFIYTVIAHRGGSVKALTERMTNLAHRFGQDAIAIDFSYAILAG